MIQLVYFITLFLFVAPLVCYLLCLLLSSDKKNNLIVPETKKMAVSIIIPCYNEEKFIEKKINELEREALFAGISEYEIIVVSDGSTDGTNYILKKLSDEGKIKVYFLPVRKGKANALNIGVKEAANAILLFSDSRQEISEGAVKKLICHFSDPSIAAVSCKLVHKDDKSPIRKIINHLKELESCNCSTISVYGPLYAVRKNYFTILPENTILDDFFISLKIIANGGRVIMEPGALVYDLKFDSLYSKQRILRTINGLLQIVKEHRPLLKSINFKYKLFLFCQKYYKLEAPLIFILLSLIAFFNTTILLWHSVIATILLITLTILSIQTVNIIFYFLFIYFTNLFTMKKYYTPLWTKR